MANSSVGAAKSAPGKDSLPQEQSMLHATLPSGKKLSSRPFGRHRRGTDKKRRFFSLNWRTRTFWLRSGIAAMAVIILIGGFLVTKGFVKANKVFKGGGAAAALQANVEPEKLKGEGDGRVNILLLGRGGEGHDGADLTDTILVASIDPVNNKAALLSLPRDLWVTTSNGSSKINAVFANAKSRALYKGQPKQKAEEAGMAAIQQEVTDVLGVSIHYHAVVDFAAFKQAVDAVGGVDIAITEKTAVKEQLYDTTIGKKYYLNVPVGMQHFDGQRALFFSRSRHTSARGDFDRSERQRVFIEALTKKVSSAQTFTNPVKVSQLMDAFGDHIATDLSLNDAMRLLSIGKKVGGFDSIDLADPAKPLVKTGMLDGQSVVMPVLGPRDYSEIQSLVRARLRDGYLEKENAVITVLNGTSTPGLATKKAEELRSYGYNVGTVADAPTQEYQDTVVVDISNGKNPYTKNYLEKRIGVKTTTKLPDQTIQPGTAKFVIILGQNETINR